MIRKMVPHGSDVAIIIDKPLMEQLELDIDTPLEISTDGKNLILSPVRDIERLEKLKTSLDKINKKHGKTLERLAQ
jgi:antitoxin component of MazEF toxin-antitoxin module